MNFWENVEYVREYREITRKELAYKANFSINSISTGITRGSFPAVDVAYRIAKVLNVSVEFLLSENILRITPAQPTLQTKNENQILKELSARAQNILSYSDMVEDFSVIPATMQKTLAELIHKIATE